MILLKITVIVKVISYGHPTQPICLSYNNLMYNHSCEKYCTCSENICLNELRITCMERVYLKVVFQNEIFFIEKVLLVMPSNRKVKVKVNTILYFLNTFPNRWKIQTNRIYLKLWCWDKKKLSYDLIGYESTNSPYLRHCIE